MIWFFLMGMIAGAIGVILVLRWWILTHVTKITPEEFMKEIEDAEKDEARAAEDKV